ncbi:helix-turn-helix domain-containing protein [Ktedonosporobacter rubrisoli]|uniref:helix-turn-helix domain-containing protein n=1 Tax=Ktedonosporobacter rubrisoli TaxID=2509675 RepID=UPI0013EEE861|nr:helix-turn-helix domain-containing protein [Ktedonosporobacter rubrisoli]
MLLFYLLACYNATTGHDTFCLDQLIARKRLIKRKFLSQPGSLGDYLRQCRLRLGLSQEALASAIGASARSIQRWERDLAIPQEIFRLRLSQLFESNAGQAPIEAIIAPVLSPSIWYVPYLRNACFVGREEVLQNLHALLSAEDPVAHLRTVALSGLGGIGKTQVALEYAYRYASSYRAILWLRAETRESLTASLQDIARLLHLPGLQGAEQSQIGSAVLQWLVIHTNWLLIADNVEDLNLLQEVLPLASLGALLITTRHQALGTLAEPLKLSPMSSQEGSMLVLRRARLLSTVDGRAALEPELLRSPMVTGIVELVSQLGGLPLALDQAGGYLEETGCSVAEYLERYYKQRKHILDRRGLHAGAHPASLSATLRLSVEMIAQEHPAAIALLRACAFLHPEAIPEELLLAGAAYLEPELSAKLTDPYHFDLLLTALRRASLVARSAETRSISVHRLVQAVLQDQMEPAEVHLWIERLIAMLNAVFPESSFDTWPQCKRYLAHAQTCIAHLEPAASLLPDGGELSYKAGSYLMECGCYKEAEPLLKRAVAQGEQQYGPRRPVLILRLEKLAELFWLQGRYQPSEALYLRVLGLETQLFGPTHPKVAETLNNLAALYWSLGEYEKAEPLYLRALCAQKLYLGSGHPEIATTLGNLACLYRDLGRYGQAEVLYMQALHIDERHLGLEHPGTTITLNNLALLYQYQGQHEQARLLYRRVLRIQKRLLGLEHPEMATTFSHLATLYQALGKYKAAEPLFLLALRIRVLRLGLEHPKTSTTLANLTLLRKELGKPAEVECLVQQALHFRALRYKSVHPYAETCKNSYTANS